MGFFTYGDILKSPERNVLDFLFLPYSFHLLRSVGVTILHPRLIDNTAFVCDISDQYLSKFRRIDEGLSKVRKLTSYGRSEVFVGKKLYYAAYDKGSMKKAVLYRCNKDGTGRKKIAVFINPHSFYLP